MNCLVNTKGELLEILQEEREPLEGQFTVPLEGFYEVLNAEHYSVAAWDFELKKWVGVGEPSIPPVPQPTEYDILKSEIDFGRMVREVQQSEIDYLKLIGGI